LARERIAVGQTIVFCGLPLQRLRRAQFRENIVATSGAGSQPAAASQAAIPAFSTLLFFARARNDFHENG
jgi:hypothetical protein